MAEYIERNKVLGMSYCPTPLTQDNPLADIKAVVDVEDIESIPTADVEEVKHGEWKHECLECSVCKRNISEIYDADSYMAYGIEDELKYCPYCGAKMDGGETE